MHDMCSIDRRKVLVHFRQTLENPRMILFSYNQITALIRGTGGELTKREINCHGRSRFVVYVLVKYRKISASETEYASQNCKYTDKLVGYLNCCFKL